MTVSAPYYGDSAVMRTPPPDLPSLLLKERIVYLGLPLFSDDDAKRQMGIDVTELIIAQLLYLEFDNPEKPIFFYINSTGTSWYSGDAIGFETEAFAIADTIRYLKDHGRFVVYDAEHAFDGFKDAPEYALATWQAAEKAGSLDPKKVAEAMHSGMTFNTVIAAALKRGDTALGYLLASSGSEAKLNPNRTDKVKFSAGDGIVVLTK